MGGEGVRVLFEDTCGVVSRLPINHSIRLIIIIGKRNGIELEYSKICTFGGYNIRARNGDFNDYVCNSGAMLKFSTLFLQCRPEMPQECRRRVSLRILQLLMSFSVPD